jgi:hypothetical protein
MEGMTGLHLHLSIPSGISKISFSPLFFPQRSRESRRGAPLWWKGLKHRVLVKGWEVAHLRAWLPPSVPPPQTSGTHPEPYKCPRSMGCRHGRTLARQKLGPHLGRRCEGVRPLLHCTTPVP